MNEKHRPTVTVATAQYPIEAFATFAEFQAKAARWVQDAASRGAELLLVPSCTDTEAGYQRVRLSAQARAIEQQVAVVQSPTVGEALWSPAVDINIGRAGVYTPCDHGFPPDGVLTRAADATPGWQIARLDLAAIRELRDHGQVNNHADWSLQDACLAAGITQETFT